MDLQVGKEYLVKHSRKGTFAARVAAFDSTWATLVMSGGKASARMAYNEATVGDEVVVRLTLCQFTEQPIAVA